jgi:GNAT superfamily N-acetyltransferase
MFELTDTILERIIFAMEDQSKSFLIDLATGELVEKTAKDDKTAKVDKANLVVHSHQPPLADQSLGSDQLADQLANQLADQLVPPPEWQSADGFKMMELYVATVRNPELKAELSQALSQGKRVFKTFKEILARSPKAEKSFADFKMKYMKKRINDWLNSLREAKGLSQLPGEPEETEDILLADFSVSVTSLAALPFDPAPLLDECVLEAGDCVPPALLALEKESLQAFLAWRPVGNQEENKTDNKAHHQADNPGLVDNPGLATYVLDEEDRPIALALGALENHGSHGLARIRFVYVLPGYRRLGLATLLLQALVDRFRAAQVSSVYIDSLVLPGDFQSHLLTMGFTPFGVHCSAQTE